MLDTLPPIRKLKSSNIVTGQYLDDRPLGTASSGFHFDAVQLIPFGPGCKHTFFSIFRAVQAILNGQNISPFFRVLHVSSSKGILLLIQGSVWIIPRRPHCCHLFL